MGEDGPVHVLETSNLVSYSACSVHFPVVKCGVHENKGIFATNPVKVIGKVGDNKATVVSAGSEKKIPEVVVGNPERGEGSAVRGFH